MGVLITDRPEREAVAGVTCGSLADALALGSGAWDELVARAVSGSPFMSWAWHRAWAESAPAAAVDASQVLQLHGSDGSRQALMPVRVSLERFRRITVRALRWAAGDDGCPDEVDLPALPNADVGPLAAALDGMPWQVLALSNLAEHAPHAKRLCATLEARGHTVRYRPMWRCPQFQLPASWDAYLAGLSANRRQILRRKERGLHRDHTVTITDYDGERLESGWEHLLALHRMRWEEDGGGAFSDPRIVRMQRRFADEMAGQGRLWLATLDVDGQPAAAWYGFASDTTVYFYQGGRDPRWDRDSVGLVLMAVMIRRAIERGFRTFNFLRGDDPYKRQWTSEAQTTGEFVVFRAGWRGLSLRLLDSLAGLRNGGNGSNVA